MANGEHSFIKVLPMVISIVFGMAGIGYGAISAASNASHGTLQVSIDALKENVNTAINALKENVDDFKSDTKAQLNNIMQKLDTKVDKQK